jgi:oxygen-independent coproporphyrinogen-3 oxidase
LAIAARHGQAKRSFQGYAPGLSDVTIGVGPSAISTLPQGYAQNAADVAVWRRAIEVGRLATTRGHELSRDDERRSAIIEHLMCGFGVDLTAYGGEGAFTREMTELLDLHRSGLVHIDGAKLSIPEAARPFTRIVASVFDAYRQDGSVQYSRVI